jgi:hypothetical protein
MFNNNDLHELHMKGKYEYCVIFFNAFNFLSYLPLSTAYLFVTADSAVMYTFFINILCLEEFITIYMCTYYICIPLHMSSKHDTWMVDLN